MKPTDVDRSDAPLVAQRHESDLPAAPDGGHARDAVALSRLHAATLWLPTCEVLLGAIVPGFIATFFVGPWLVIWSIIYFVLVPVTLVSAYRFFTLGFHVTGEELIFHSGLIFRRQRKIPLNRIQDVDIRQGILHRLLNLAKAEVTTAGSDAKEVSLNVLSKAAADALRRAVVARHQAAVNDVESAQPEADCLLQLSLRELVIGGLTSNLVASLGALVGVIVYFGVLARVASRWMEWEEKLFGSVYGHLEQWTPSEGPMGFFYQLFWLDDWPIKVFFVAAGLLLSVGKYVLKYHGFRLTRHRQMLEKAHGLLTHQRGTLARQRVQALKIEEGLLRRWFGLAAVRVDSAGDRNELDEKKKRDVLVPVATNAQAREVASQTMPGLPTQGPAWKRVSRKAIMRGSKKGWLLLLAVVMLQTFFFSPWTILVWLPGIPLVYFLNYQWYRNTGYYLDDKFLISRKGWLNRETLYLPIGNTQNVSLIQNFFDRRVKLATLSVDTAGQSNTGGGPVIRNLPLDEARRMYQQLATQAAAVKAVL